MAEVLTPIVQQTGSITMLHTPADAFQNNPSSQSHHQSSRSQKMPRQHMYSTQNGGIGYRGTSATPVAPYAFQSTPQLRQESRSSSTPTNPYTQQSAPGIVRQGHASSSSESTTSSTSSRSMRGQVAGSRDDSTIQRAAMGKAQDDMVKKHGLETRPNPALAMSTSVPDLSFASFDTPTKPSPDRYRRGNRRADSYYSSPNNQQPEPQQTPSRSATPSGSGMANVAHLYNGATGGAPTRAPHLRTSSADDTQLPRQGSSEVAKRYRRRSVGSFEPSAFTNINTSAGSPAFAGPTLSATGAKRQDTQEARPSGNPRRPISFHERKNSGDSLSSSSTRPPSARQDQKSSVTTSSNAQHSLPPPRHDARPAIIPPRGSSDANKRPMNPSPLSQGASGTGSSNLRPTSSRAVNVTAAPPSPAAQHLAALSDKDLNKGMKSRLRRAFSFGSSAELRKASAENNMSAERAKLHKERVQDNVEAEHEAIAAKQEAGGIGAGIYSGQGNFFSGSTDNLSISSTASSASIMLRKMGKGMRKSTRSIKGLFRPKSVIGVRAADGPVAQPSLGQVSMVTVEAEREKVNVNIDPHDQVGGGTGYPKLERNSLDAARAAVPEVPNSSHGPAPCQDSRKSIVGGERERAEVLAAVKKGILKRTGTNSETSSPTARPSDGGTTDTPRSSAPSTPNDDHQPVNIGGEDYFVGGPRFGNSSTRSLPNTPHGSRNISFSPRIQFHDAWSSSEYDRRGDIATCNRLTPMLAQQIKEELNSFKMEMEVHELSKPHTHFF